MIEMTLFQLIYHALFRMTEIWVKRMMTVGAGFPFPVGFGNPVGVVQQLHPSWEYPSWEYEWERTNTCM